MVSLSFPLAILVSVLVYVLCMMMVPKQVMQQADPRLKASLRRLKQEQDLAQHGSAEEAVTASADEASPIMRAFLFIPGSSKAMPLIRRAGYAKKIEKLFIGGVVVFAFLSSLTARLGALSILYSALGTLLLLWFFLNNQVRKRRRQFLEEFPDAIDMIVRSVRSGYPLNTALGMVAENMGGVTGIEFQRIVDEIRYGWSPYEALNRFSDRMKEPDIRFFVTVLAVQQETGGNLSEVLTNLSKLLRQRKQLRLKIRALSSEGRVTAWILGALPVFIFLALSYMSPQHLVPLYDTTMGNFILGGAVGMVLLGMLIVKAMINVDI